MTSPSPVRRLPSFLPTATGCSLGLALTLAAAITAPAAEPSAGVRYDDPAASASAEDSRHHVGVFVGGATRFHAPEEEEEETGLAVGLEYEYRFAKHWGTGALLEGVTTDHARDGILVIPLNFHPWEWLKLSAAPGVEFVDGGGEEFVVRLGAAYEFEFGQWNLAPEVSLDFTRETRTVVYGLTLGRRF